MSDKPKNEQIIEELTAGLEDSLVGDKSTSSDSEDDSRFAECEDSEHPDFQNLRKNTDPKEHKVEEDESNEDDDIVAKLKDLELTLSEEEKLARKNEALEFKSLGNDNFKFGEFSLSEDYYSKALAVCPLCYSADRAIFYCNRAAARMKLDKYKPAIEDCTRAIENDPNYVKAYFRRAQCYESTEKLDESLADFKKILEFDPGHREANEAMLRLPPLIEERNEKLKAEMLGKLKDIGNLILKPFGLSTNNFQMVQDPETKGYSINFKK